MASFGLPRLAELDEAAIARLRQRGFLVLEGVLDADRIAALRDRFPKPFAGQFDTGVYPDEWYWREGMSLPEVTRHMANAWKADLSVARLALSEDVGRAAAHLAGWSGARLSQDTIWWKAPKTKPIAHQEDTSFTDFLDPPGMATCWVILDDTHRAAGTREYARGSYLWPLTPIPEEFHGQEDYRAHMRAAARVSGVEAPEPVMIEVTAGSCVVHAGEVWHGSGPNTTGDQLRRAIGIHLLGVRFSDRPGGHIYRRYQRTDDPSLDESFFPVLWSRSGARTGWIEAYCATGRRTASETQA